MAEENTRARIPAPTNPTQAGVEEHADRPIVFSVVVVQGPAAGARVALEREVVIGRDPRCELPIGAADVSRRHARIVPDSEGHRVVDLGSTNGTWVNGRPITSRKLAPGDRIELGSCVLRYLRQGEADAEDLGALADLARRDALTGLANRRAFEESLQREVARARRSGGALAVVVLDVDHFKRVNDTHGHAAGDVALAEVAARSQRALRAEDLLAASAARSWRRCSQGPPWPPRRRWRSGSATPSATRPSRWAPPTSTSPSPSAARRSTRTSARPPRCWPAPTPACTTQSAPDGTG
jgi:hypothetical protein